MTGSHILVVDDDPQIRRVMRVTLIAQGYEVNEARSGEEALARLQDQRFDLVLLDINLPGTTGLEVCRELRSVSDGFGLRYVASRCHRKGGSEHQA
jgi:CheY-like chemotaxis protein